MTAVPAYEIRCDACGQARTGYGTATQVRATVRDGEGWLVSQPGGRDTCSDCRRRA